MQIFEWTSWNHFLGKWDIAFKLFKSKFDHRKLLRKSAWSYLELKNKYPERLKKTFFSFWVTKLKLFSYILGTRTFLENGFQATLSSKANVLNAWKKDFPVICKFLSDEVKPFSGKGRQTEAIYLNQSFVIQTSLEHGFEATLISKTTVLSVWKKHFPFFLQMFEWRSWNHFLGKWGKVLKSI